MNKICKNTSLIKKVERKDQRGVNWWLRLHSPNAGGMGLIPGQETKISQATSHGQKEKKKKKRKNKKGDNHKGENHCSDFVLFSHHHSNISG